MYFAKSNDIDDLSGNICAVMAVAAGQCPRHLTLNGFDWEDAQTASYSRVKIGQDVKSR